ncbi:MAG: response regulator [Methanosarcina sp.]|jgi:two-component system cell cycle response regulator DivK|nr:response regulator [Methanosarcina sp.]MDD3316237.1 response regulator [Methanosarcina sp.]MDD4305036.1 response regulator [Methanosarcina sp.]MDD4619693.1 response regulator [Methanosarcina sp.]
MKKILIVEDNIMNMELVQDLLELYGHKVIKAEDGIKALERLAEEKIDIILLDMQLPKMGGLEVLDRIKKNPATADIPIIAVTAHAMKGSEEHFIEMGCVDYVSKPIDIHRFRALIDKYLGEH